MNNIINNFSNLTSKQIEEISYNLEEPNWFKEKRKEAFEYFNRLAIENSPLYIKHYDLTGLNLTNSTLSFKENLLIPSEIEKILTNLKFLPFVCFLDGNLYQINLPKPLQDKGLRIENIASYLKNEKNLKLLINYKTVNSNEDKFAALNDAFFTSGILIEMPEGMQLKVPLRIINVLTKENKMSFIQNFIIGKEDCKFTIIEENFSCNINKNQSLFSQNINIVLKENAELEYISLNNFKEVVNYFTNKRVKCEKDARISWILGYFGGLISRSKTDNYMAKEGAFSNMIEILVGSLNQKFDLTSYLTHNSPYTKSVALSRGVLKDEARTLLKGMIKIAENAKNSNAYLAEHAMILNKGARADSIPGLEIANNDVRATHSASVTQIDEEQIFYLMSRGLDEENAKKLLTVCFFQPLLDQIPLEEVKNKLFQLIEDKLENKDRNLEEKFIITKEIKEIKRITPEKMFETHYKYRK